MILRKKFGWFNSFSNSFNFVIETHVQLKENKIIDPILLVNFINHLEGIKQ